jgi:hypothetical protein
MSCDSLHRRCSWNGVLLLIVCCLILPVSGCGSSPSNLTSQVTGGGGGTGGGSAQHEVSLTWNPPTSSPVAVAGYNVYRSSGSSSAYSAVNPSVVTQASYTDSNVTSGTTYSYYVESVDGSGNPSAPSNTVSVTIP